MKVYNTDAQHDDKYFIDKRENFSRRNFIFRCTYEHRKVLNVLTSVAICQP